MKKPWLGVVGVVGACAVCCTLPVVTWLVAGASAIGLTALIDWEYLNSAARTLGAGAALGATVLVGAALWWTRRRKATACQCAP